MWKLNQLYENHLRYDQFHHNVWRWKSNETSFQAFTCVLHPRDVISKHDVNHKGFSKVTLLISRPLR